MMPSNKPEYKLRSEPERHEAIAELAKAEGFKSVTGYLDWLLDNRAREVGFYLPKQEGSWGGRRETEELAESLKKQFPPGTKLVPGEKLIEHLRQRATWADYEVETWVNAPYFELRDYQPNQGWFIKLPGGQGTGKVPHEIIEQMQRYHP
jgi:hypothetical protein